MTETKNHNQNLTVKKQDNMAEKKNKIKTIL